MRCMQSVVWKTHTLDRPIMYEEGDNDDVIVHRHRQAGSLPARRGQNSFPSVLVNHTAEEDGCASRVHDENDVLCVVVRVWVCMAWINQSCVCHVIHSRIMYCMPAAAAGGRSKIQPRMHVAAVVVVAACASGKERNEEGTVTRASRSTRHLSSLSCLCKIAKD